MQQSDELRPCPFCAHEQPQLTALGDDRVEIGLHARGPILCLVAGGGRAAPQALADCIGVQFRELLVELLIQSFSESAAEAKRRSRANPLPNRTHDIYEAADTFADVYAEITERLVAAAAEHGDIVYAVPADGTDTGLDTDGTLVDSVYQHVIAWQEALTACGIPVSVWRIHRRIGMSGGLFLDALQREIGGDRYRAAPLLRRMVAEGRSGRTAGSGFYAY